MDPVLASCTDAAALAAAIAHRCPQAGQHGEQWQACCPAHDDHTPSLSITPAADKVLLYCHAQCPLDAILAALGLTRRDLFVHGATHRNGHRHIVQVYDSIDAHGVLVHQTVRLTPKAFRQRRPGPVTSGAWLWNLEGVEPVLYHLPQVIAAIQRGETIYVGEGEKDAEALQALGLTATCNAMGAGKWRPSYSAALRGASVVVLPDNDPPGYQYAREICTALAGIAARCKLVPLHTGTLHSDVSDWLHAGGTRTALEAAVEAVPWETGPNAQGQDAPSQTAHAACDPVDAARQAADRLLRALPTLAGDAKEDTILDALPDLIPLDMRRWMRLKRQLKAAVPGLNMQDLGQAQQELRRMAARQASPTAGRSQAHIATALAKDAAGQLAYDLGRQAWMAYDQGRWQHLETERVTQRIMARMDEETLVIGDWVWLSSVEGAQQNVTPYQIGTITPGTDGHRYARFAETPTGWPLAQRIFASSGSGLPCVPQQRQSLSGRRVSPQRQGCRRPPGEWDPSFRVWIICHAPLLHATLHCPPRWIRRPPQCPSSPRYARHTTGWPTGAGSCSRARWKR